MGKSLPHREYKSIVYHSATGTLWLTHLLQKFQVIYHFSKLHQEYINTVISKNKVRNSVNASAILIAFSCFFVVPPSYYHNSIKTVTSYYFAFYCVHSLQYITVFSSDQTWRLNGWHSCFVVRRFMVCFPARSLAPVPGCAFARYCECLIIHPYELTYHLMLYCRILK